VGQSEGGRWRGWLSERGGGRGGPSKRGRGRAGRSRGAGVVGGTPQAWPAAPGRCRRGWLSQGGGGGVRRGLGSEGEGVGGSRSEGGHARPFRPTDLALRASRSPPKPQGAPSPRRGSPLSSKRAQFLLPTTAKLPLLDWRTAVLALGRPWRDAATATYAATSPVTRASTSTATYAATRSSATNATQQPLRSSQPQTSPPSLPKPRRTPPPPPSADPQRPNHTTNPTAHQATTRPRPYRHTARSGRPSRTIPASPPRAGRGRRPPGPRRP
jgi:hypothetical protein